MNVKLHIESLVLHGIPEGGRDAFAEAFRARLTELIASGGLPEGLSSVERLGAVAPGLGGARGSEAIGAEIGAAVYGALSHG